jgi:hypothetical protein
MRKLVSVFGIVATLQVGMAQQSTPPAAPPAQLPPTTTPRPPGNPTPAPSPDVPRAPGNPTPAPSPEVPRSRGILPPGPGVNPTNSTPVPSGRDTVRPNTNLIMNPSQTGIATPGFTNLPATNRLGLLTNNLLLKTFAITNALTSMSPAQAQNVMQVQNALNHLQNAVANFAGAPNAQSVIQQNPQLQQQLQQISTQINALAQGPIKPSPEIVQRLSSDLLAAFSRARVSPDSQMVLAVIINQACNSGRLSAEQVNELVDNALYTLQGSGVPTAVAHPVRCDLHSIAYELQPNLGS